ncbi:MAG: glucose-1-phosphate adenylyltransferase subunit GlgD [Ruminococcus sp.]
MRNNDVLGIVFSNTNEEALSELTARRTTASVPIGGKYRIIDFILSVLSNAGINNVGIITNKNYMSLMDHVGSGKAWDLSKRRSGLTILPPYDGKDYSNVLEMLYNARGYLESCREQYVLLCNSSIVSNMDFGEVIKFHSEKDADATVVYEEMQAPQGIERPMILRAGEDGKIDEILITPNPTGVCNITFGTMLVAKDLLLSIVKEELSLNHTNFKKVIQEVVSEYNVYGYKNTNYSAAITSIKEYFNFNMDLMNPNVRAELFSSERPIYTKVRDDTPCRYGLNCEVKRSLISQGCVIDGTVENCVLSKGVHIGEGSVVKNCIIMQDTEIGKNVNLSYVIIDKDVVIQDGRSLMGYESYPIYISKKSKV